MSSLSRFMNFSTVSAAALLGLSPLATAQTPAEDDPLVQNTITVTVQKREQSLQDVPVTLSALDDQILTELGLDEFDQVARFIPGLEVQEQSPNNPGFVIRGITSDSGEANIEPRIAVFQDGVSISRSRGSIVELFDLERVEVAKGPQPTLFGRGALIGGINVIQAKPQFEGGGHVTAGLGNLGEIYLDGHITGPIVDDMLAFRLAARSRRRQGFVDSLNPEEEDFNSESMDAFRASLAYTPTSDLRFDLILNYQEDKPSGTSFKSGAFEPVPGASTDAWDPAFLNTFGNFLGGKGLGTEREIFSSTLLAEWQINDALTLTSITGNRNFESVEVFDPDGFALPLLIFAEDAEGDQFSQEFRVNFDDGGPLTGFAGISYINEDGRQFVPLTYDERAVQAFLGGFIVPPVAPPVEALPAINLTALQQSGGTLVVPLKPIHNEFYANTGKTESVDIFADGTFAVTPKLELTAGVRYTQDDKTTGIEVGNLNGPSNLTFGGIFVTAGTGPAENALGTARLTSSDTFDGVTWRLAAKYELTEDWNLFANTARGRRPDVITASTTDAANRFTQLPAEEVDSYEIGTKGFLFEGDLALDASVFYYDYTNFQTSIIDDNGVIVPLNAGNATSYGLETQANWNVSENFDFVASYGYNRARFEDEVDGQPQEFGGNKLRLSPDHTFATFARFNFDTPVGNLRLVPNLTWQSEVFFDNTERDLISQDGYFLVNFDAALTFDNGLELQYYIKNAFDEEYLIDAGNTGDAFGIPTFISGKPLQWGVRVRKDF
ncbi:MAG: TonB-dependent receptor [Hyphomonadaceae bacterium]|nr:TonB-dependent receptor [Hyphomonadaceae bacterium]